MINLILTLNSNNLNLLEINECEINTFDKFKKKDVKSDLKNIILYLKDLNSNDLINVWKFIKNNKFIFSDDRYNIFVFSDNDQILQKCKDYISQINTSRQIRYVKNLTLIKNYVCSLSKEMIQNSFNASEKVYDIDKDYLIEEYNDYIIFSIRGSDDHRDFYHNLKFLIKNKDGMHRGFVEYLNKVLIDVLFDKQGRINIDNWKGKKIILTGHSLGGAAALIFAFKILQLDTDLDIAVVTIGAPKVGDKNFVDGFKSSDIIRFYFSDDVVNKVPLRDSHINRGISLKDNNFFPNLISNHFLKNYKEFIDETLLNHTKIL